MKTGEQIIDIAGSGDERRRSRLVLSVETLELLELALRQPEAEEIDQQLAQYGNAFADALPIPPFPAIGVAVLQVIATAGVLPARMRQRFMSEVVDRLAAWLAAEVDGDPLAFEDDAVGEGLAAWLEAEVAPYDCANGQG